MVWLSNLLSTFQQKANLAKRRDEANSLSHFAHRNLADWDRPKVCLPNTPRTQSFVTATSEFCHSNHGLH